MTDAAFVCADLAVLGDHLGRRDEVGEEHDHIAREPAAAGERIGPSPREGEASQRPGPPPAGAAMPSSRRARSASRTRPDGSPSSCPS